MTDKTAVFQGGHVTVSGKGYGADEDVDIYLHSSPVLLATVTADSAGVFSVVVTIPSDTKPSNHSFEGAGLDTLGEPLSLTAPIRVMAAGEQPATETLPPTPASQAPVSPIGLGVVLIVGTLVLVAMLPDRRRRRR